MEIDRINFTGSAIQWMVYLGEHKVVVNEQNVNAFICINSVVFGYAMDKVLADKICQAEDPVRELSKNLIILGRGIILVGIDEKTTEKEIFLHLEREYEVALPYVFRDYVFSKYSPPVSLFAW